MTADSLQGLLDHPRLVPAVIVAIGLGALGAALASQFWGGLEPCVLCMYQRYAYLGAVAMGLAGLALGGNPETRRVAVALAGLAFLTGAGIAVFHVGVEQHWWRGTAECHAPVFDPDAAIEDLRKQLLGVRFAPCDVIPWSLLGISMAGYNVLASMGLAAASLWAALKITGARQR